MNQRPRQKQRPARRLTPRARITPWQALMQVHADCARDSLRRLLATPAASLMTVFVVAIALLLPALLQVLNANLAAVDSGFLDSSQITLYLDDTVSEARGREVSERLLSMEGIDSVVYLSKDEALADFVRYSGLGDVLEEMPANPLPATILVVPADRSATATASLLQALTDLPEVARAQSDLEWLQRLDALRAVLGRLNLVFTSILSLAVLFIMGNTIRLAIENRRTEIAVVKLVGGTDSFAARPFLYTGLWLGLGGGLLASLLISLVLLSFSGPLQALLGLYESGFPLQGTGAGHLLLLVLTGALLGWLGALISTGQQLLALGDG